MFNERKAAQMAAFFLGQLLDRKMPHLKLMKLLYLSDREAVRAFGWPISGDRLVSMPHGPVLSQHCAEWKDPKGSSFPIQYDALARAVGFDDASAKELAAQIQAEQEIDRIFAAL